MDWYESVDVEIKYGDYYYYKIERRFGPSWWLVGRNPVDEPRYHWEETSIGEIGIIDLKRFIEWSKDGKKGSKITEVRAICSDFNILVEIAALLV